MQHARWRAKKKEDLRDDAPRLHQLRDASGPGLDPPCIKLQCCTHRSTKKQGQKAKEEEEKGVAASSSPRTNRNDVRGNLCTRHETVLRARATVLLAARWGINTPSRPRTKPKGSTNDHGRHERGEDQREHDQGHPRQR